MLLRRYFRLTARAKKVVHPAVTPEDVLAIERQANVWSEMTVFRDVHEISDKQHHKLLNEVHDTTAGKALSSHSGKVYKFNKPNKLHVSRTKSSPFKYRD